MEIGNFQSGSVVEKIEYESAELFWSVKDGINKQTGALPNLGLLSRLSKILTGSKNFIPDAHQGYFIRIFCHVFAKGSNKGLASKGTDFLNQMVFDKFCHKAKGHLGQSLSKF